MKKPEIDDIYPLSPMQRGMLFHSLYEPGSGVYLQQVSCTLPAGLDVKAWKAAWDEVVKRHAALRTSFVWQRREQPLQVVLRRVELPWAELDWQEAEGADLLRLEEAWQRRDAAADLPLDHAPLMRFTLALLSGGAWRFLWSVHHLIVDGWSVALALGEALSAYEALRSGRPPAYGLVARYGDYVSWLEGRDPSAAEAFWRAELAGFGAPTPLGVERAAGGAATAPAGTGWESAEAVLPPGASAALRELARRWWLTLSTVVQGAWAQLLGGYGGGDDVVFGLTVFGRPPELPGAAGTVGLFINTLPVRVRARPEEPLRAWLQELQRQGARRGEFQHAPLSDIQGWSEVPRGRPLFESLLILDSAGMPRVDSAAAAAGIAELRIEGRSNYPLNLVLVPDAALQLRLLFDDRRLDAAAVARLAVHLRNLLEAMAADPDCRLGDLSLLGPAEVRQLLFAWNPAPAPYPRDRGLAELFAARVQCDPEALAVQFEGVSLSYGELDSRSNRLARQLLRLGVRVEAPVALCLARSADLVVAMLAVIKAGAAYVPLDPEHPEERLRLMLQDSGSAVLISHRGLGEELTGTAVRALRLDADAASIARHSAASLPPRAGGGHLAYLIYTSGSTGKPKGVAVEQRAVSRLVLGTDYVDLGPGDRVAQAANASFDAITFEVWGALLTGGAVIGVSKEVALTPRAFAAWIESAGIDVMFVTTALARQIAREAPACVSRLRVLLFGGERADARWVRKLREEGRPHRLLHVYGPTETTTFATWQELGEAGAGDLAVPIGRAIGHTDVVVLDSWLRPALVGVAGELYIGGDGLARGYWRRPELTAARFVPDPLAGGVGRPAGRRLYRTGDLVRWLPQGSLEFLGRLDGQVKVRGFRVELGEVEAALLEHPAVREVAVVPREPEPGDRALAAFWVAAGEGVEGRELARWLRGRLPEPMVPASWHEVAELPLTPNGKIDRQRLSRLAAAGTPEGAAAAAGEGQQRPASLTPTQAVLAAIWAELLQVGRVEVDDNFFELGGHSLLATQVASRIAEAFQVEVPLAAVFEARALGELALRIEALQVAAQGPPLPPIRPAPRRRDLPLSYAQERMWFIEQMLAGGTAYNMPAAVRLRGALHTGALRFALGEVVRRHEVLRTTFAAPSGRPVQVIAPAAGWLPPVITLAALPAAASHAEARRLAAAEAARPFDLARGPLLRARLLRLAAVEHVLLLVMHHIVADGWSMGVLVTEITALYGAAVAGRPAALPELPVQYADFAVWQREVLDGEVFSRQLQYWRQRLAGAPTALDLPADRPRPAAQSFRGANLELALDTATAARFRQLARRHGATLFMVLLGGFAALLRRLTGQEDLMVGVPIANRNRLATEQLIGFFANSLVLRLDISGAPGFDELVPRMRRAALEAYAHQDLPFERLVEDLRPERRLSQSPLFQVMFTVQAAPLADLALPGLQLSPFDFRLATAKFDLELTFVEMGGDEAGELRGALGFATDLFDAATIRRLAEQIEVLFAGAAADPARPLTDLPLLSPALRHQLTWEWNDTAAAASAVGDDVVVRWRTQVARSPGSVALRCGESTLTYGDLDQRARRLARRLLALGLGPGARVALCAGRTPELVTGILAALTAGCAYVPLDPALPPARLAFMLEDAAVSALLVEPCWVEHLPPHGAAVLLLGAETDADGEELQAPPATSPAELAYLIYTSGTTGRPKAVMVSRGNLANTMAATQRLFRFAPDDQMAVLAPASFDAFAFELFSALLAGGTAVLVARSPVLDVERLVAGLGELTRIVCVTSLMRQIVEGARRGAAAGSGFPRMRTLGTGGETVPAGLLADMRETFPAAEVWVLYGPTEAAILSSGHRVPPAPAQPRPLLGRPLDNVTHQLRDAAGELVPPGVVGELWIGGAGVSPGYWGQEALSAERFTAARYPEEGRWFHTGDLARQLADGTIEFLGRHDEQVKLRGYRVELGEIEALLEEHPAVRAAAVAAHQTATGDSRLAAYVVPAEGAMPCSVETLREWLRSRLPDYMVPAAFLLLDELPHNVHGKVDRRALPPPAEGWADLSSGATYLLPRTAAEKALASIWAAVLGVERVGLDDHFFELGGHSLLATQVVSRVRAEFGAELPLREVFQEPVLRDMARALDRHRAAAPEAPPIEPAVRSGPIPLSFAQQRLWFLERLAPDSPFYNIFSPVRLDGRLDVRALAAALGEIIRRHESLRTCFPAAGGQPRQLVVPPAPFVLPVVDLSGLGAAAAAPLDRLIAVQKGRQFDLSRCPLLRVLLVREGPERHALLVTVHHVVADGWSMEILFQELAVLYNAFSQGLPSPLPALPIQYADFAIWQRDWFRGEALARQLRYWKEQLAGAPPVLELPLDRPAPAVEAFRGGLVPLHVPPALGRSLRALSRAHQATLSVVVLAAFETLLHRYTGQDDVLVGTGVANRNRKEIEPLIGFFVNTLVLRGRFAGDPTFADLLRRLRETSIEAFSHQDLPFEMLVEELAVERSLSHNPVCQVMYAFHNFPLTTVETRGLKLSPFTLEQVETGTAKFDLTLFAWESGAGIDCMVEYNGDLFEKATILRAACHLEELLREIASAPGLRVSQYRMLAPGEIAQLLREWNATAAAYPRDATLQQVFEAHAAGHPEAVALESAAGAVTYGDLNVRANRLAARLQALGVELESRVGICLPRSVGAIVAMVATVKAGGAYVPLDPQYPEARRELVMRIAAVSVVVTRRPPPGAPAEVSGEVVFVDEMGELEPAGAGEPAAANPARGVGPDNLAYVMFTSGSTGVPKATAVAHRGVLRLVLGTNYASYGPNEVLLQFDPLSFDASTFEIWGALLHGARLGIFPPGTPTLEELSAAVERHRVTLLFLPSGLFQRFAEAGMERLRGLTQLLTGGDVMSVTAVRRALQTLPGTRLANIYGPTENTVYSAWHPLPAAESIRAPVPIGRPIANTAVYLLGRRLELVPIGVSGEICIGGDGLARGYLGQPDLTAERFIPDPFGVGARLYRTGDRARLLADGCVDFLGRIDQQVKIRGFRVELEEVELVLASHPAVRAAAVVASDHGEGDRRLVGYVVAAPPAEAAAAESQPPAAEQVASWTRFFDQLYQQQPAPAAPDFNIVGWHSTYTGEPIPAEEMREWLDDTVERALGLAPRRVLEIGCGTGLLLLRIAPHCQSYVGTDVSKQVLGSLAREVAARRLSQVQLRECPADDFSGLEPGAVDCVLLNSVVQYFPSIDYLATVLERAVEVVAPGGWVLIGDVRSLPLLQAFHASVELFQAAPEEALVELRERVPSAVEREPELIVDPAFFYALRRRLPGIGGVRIHPKRGKSHNELTKFRYQVLLRIGAPASQGPPADWEDGAALAGGAAALRRRLMEQRPATLALAKLRNSRVAADLAAARLLDGESAGLPGVAGGAGMAPETAAGLRQRVAAAAAGCLDPEEVRTIAAEAGYAVELGCAEDPQGGRFEAVLWRLSGALERAGGAAAAAAALETWTPEPLASGRPWSELANDPLRARRRKELEGELRGFLEARLPAYMVPARVLLLDRMPLNPNGKLDRKALPAPGTRRPDALGMVAPADAVERALLNIWERVLAVPAGVTDDFFELGGHSLLAIRLMAEIRGRFGVEPPLAELFLHPTVREMAARLRRPDLAGGGARLDLQPAGSLRPLFLVQPGGGDAGCYLDLAQALGPEQPVYGLRAVAPQGLGGSGMRVAEMAAANLGELRRCQPTGPYLLGGWSLGGVVAYEMAGQLSRAGEEVVLLALFDSSSGHAGDAVPPPDDALLLCAFAGQELPVSLDDLRRLDLDRQLDQLVAVPRLARLLPDGAGGAELRPLFEEFRDNALGLWHYRARPYTGRIRLFRAAHSFAGDLVPAADPTLGWGGLCPCLQVREVPGDHYSMLRSPQVEALAELLGGELAALPMSVADRVDVP